MSYQFHHKNTYGRKAGKGAKSSFNAQDIANEAERKPSACRHVKEPQPPKLLFGVMPSDAVKKSYAWAAQAKDKIGRKLRGDGLCIVAGVVSVPAGFDRWDEYKKTVIADLLAQHGDRLLSVVEHMDETHPHMHYYTVPRVGETMEDIHEGLKARNGLRVAKKTTGEQNVAYTEAMKNFQTDFHERVSKPFGLLRDGPKRERLSTPEWRVQKAAAKRDAQMMQETEAKCQAMTLAALEASAGQTAAERADALARLKTEMENLRATTIRECELNTKAEMDKARAETQAAAIKLAEAEAIKVKAVQEATTTEQAATNKLAEATQKNAEADSKVQKVKDQAGIYIAKTKDERETAKQAGYAEGEAASTPAAVKVLKADLQKANEQVARNYHMAMKEHQRAAVGEQTLKLKDAEISTLKSKLRELTPPPPTQSNAPTPAPAPRL